MTISIADRSEYFRGLLVVVRKDNMIVPREREFILAVGKALDFDPRFCEAAIDDLLKNPHIKNEPVSFEDAGLAESFLRDGVRLALIDEQADRRELKWLRAVARANGLREHATDAEVQRCRKEGSPHNEPPPFAVRRHLS